MSSGQWEVVGKKKDKNGAKHNKNGNKNSAAKQLNVEDVCKG